MIDVKKSYVPGFDYDIFVSYARVNNQIEPGTQKERWVSTFCEGLRLRVDEELGRSGRTRIYFDDNEFDKSRSSGKQLEEALNHTAVFVMLLSTGYIESPACRDEIAHFKKVVEAQRGEKIWNSGRLFIVYIRPLPEDDHWPAEFSRDKLKEYIGPNPDDNPVGYHFFIQESGRPTAKQLKPTDPLYQETLEEIRAQIAENLRSMRKAATTVTSNQEVTESQMATVTNSLRDFTAADRKAIPTVLLARATDDLRSIAKDLTTWCESAGIRVLPAKWPSSAVEFQQAFQAALSESHLVVQLLSDLTAEVDQTIFPQGREKWQYDIAKAAGVNVFRLREPKTVLDEIEVDYYRNFLRDTDLRPEPQSRFFEEVCMRVRRARDVGKSPVPDAAARSAMIKYNKDNDVVMQMVDRLCEQNIQCMASKNGRPLLDRFREVQFDGLVIVLGDCDDDWLEERGYELKAVELGLKDQAPVRAYYHPDGTKRVPPWKHKNILEIFGEAQLEIFVSELRKNGAYT